MTFTVLVFLASENTFSQPFGFVESNRPVRDALDLSSFLVFVQNVFSYICSLLLRLTSLDEDSVTKDAFIY